MIHFKYKSAIYITALLLTGCGGDDFKAAAQNLQEHCNKNRGIFTIQLSTGLFGEYGGFTCTYPAQEPNK